MFFKSILRCVLIALLACSTLAAELPPPLLDAAKQLKLSPEAFAIAILPAQSGAPLLLHQADQAFNPASTMKLLTSSVALDQLGPAWRWRTELYGNGEIQDGVLHGPLYLKGYGDPKLGFERLWLLLRELRANGVRKIDGELVLDRSYFKLPVDVANGQFDEQPERAYNVGPDALLSNFKALRFDMRSEGEQVTARIEPPLAGVSVHSAQTLSALPCEQWRKGWQRPLFEPQPDGQLRITLQGSFPRQCSASRHLGVFDHFSFTERLLRAMWAELRGEISGGSVEGRVPADAKLLAKLESDDLASQLRDINKWSNNTMARNLYLTLGAELSEAPPDTNTPQRSALAVQRWLQQRGWQWPELVLENGSGLSRTERISALHLAELIQAMQASRHGPELMASLPIAGIDGTARRVYIDRPYAGWTRLKTGTLDDVKAIAGSMRDQAGRDWVLVALINHPKAEQMQPLLDALLGWLWAQTPAVNGQ